MKLLHPAVVLNKVVMDIMLSKLLYDGRAFRKMPIGQYCQNLPEDQKDALRRLTPADASNIQEEYVKMIVDAGPAVTR